MDIWVGRRVTTKVARNNIPVGSAGKISFISKYNVNVVFPNALFTEWYSLDEITINSGKK